MNATGTYRTRFAWEAHSYAEPDDVGDPVDQYADPVNLWGGYDGERSASVGDELESSTVSHAATILIRNHVAVDALDRLTDVQTGEVWTVDHARRGDNETVVEVSR